MTKIGLVGRDGNYSCVQLYRLSLPETFLATATVVYCQSIAVTNSEPPTYLGEAVSYHLSWWEGVVDRDLCSLK